jgi:hypothetical protein
MEYYLVINKNIMLCEEKLLELEGIMLSKIIHKQKGRYCMFSLTEKNQNNKKNNKILNVEEEKGTGTGGWVVVG